MERRSLALPTNLFALAFLTGTTTACNSGAIAKDPFAYTPQPEVGLPLEIEVFLEVGHQKFSIAENLEVSVELEDIGHKIAEQKFKLHLKKAEFNEIAGILAPLKNYSGTSDAKYGDSSKAAIECGNSYHDAPQATILWHDVYPKSVPGVTNIYFGCSSELALAAQTRIKEAASVLYKSSHEHKATFEKYGWLGNEVDHDQPAHH